MNRPGNIIKELTLHKSHDYGYELSYRECRQLVDYIHDLEEENGCFGEVYSECEQFRKALDKACLELELSNKQLIQLDRSFLPMTKEQWKEYILKNE